LFLAHSRQTLTTLDSSKEISGQYMENLDHISRVVTTLDSSKEILGQYMENLEHISRVSILSYWEWKKKLYKAGYEPFQLPDHLGFSKKQHK
jgi:hypothetical protein